MAARRGGRLRLIKQKKFWKFKSNTDISGMEKIENIKNGELIKLANRKGTYIRGAYNREIKKYEYQSYDDISKFTQIKKGTKVELI